MNEGWLELESDPGLFTLLLEDFGVQGVQVEEIYDLQTTFDGPVYGFIFLFKWMEERRARRKFTQDEDSYVMDEEIINKIFFPKQIINNSCATHALLSVLLNCSKINLGSTLTQLKAFTKDMNAESKGFAIGNMPDLARAHNSHARQDPHRLPEKQQGISVRTAEAFHFVSYVPINGRLFELDGLQPYPVDHGPWGEHEEWTEHFRRVIKERLGMATNGGGEISHDIRFNLMAVVPDKRFIFEQKLKTLKTNRQIILETLQQMVKVTSPDITLEDHPFKLANGASMELALKQEDAGSLLAHKSAAELMEADSELLPVVRTSARLRAKSSVYSNAFAAMGGSGGGTGSNGLCHIGDSESVNSTDSDVFHKMPVNVVKEETDSDIEIMEDVSDDAHAHSIEKKQLQTVQNSDVKFHISVSDEKEGSVISPTTLATTDVTKPLSIQTKFGNLPPGPGTGSSTDTASEIGSCFSSPVCSTGQPSPNVLSSKTSPTGQTDVKVSQDILSKMKLEGGLDSEHYVSDLALEVKREIKSEIKSETSLSDLMRSMEAGVNVSPESSAKKRRRKFGSHHGFTPKDLLQLLKNVENEVATCENNLKEEREKFKKYKIDDGRRTHNYDQFICTFLSMLAEQGHITDLVEQQTGRKKSLAASKRAIKAKAKRRR